MAIYLKNIYIFLIFLKVKVTLQFVSDEVHGEVTEASDKVLFNRRRVETGATFWPDPNKKDLNFQTRRNCMGDTFDEVLRRYGKMIQNDGALVDFVSSDPLPGNDTVFELDTCAVNYEEIKRIKYLKEREKNKTINTTSSVDNTIDEKLEVTRPIEPTKATFRANETLDTAAVKSNSTKAMKADVPKDDKKRRASDYAFSSVEYYDELASFEEGLCPDDVDVIDLEVDQLRNYDVECEMIIEWRSLE